MKPINPAKNVSGDFDHFTSFMRKLVSVPHSEIKAKLDAEKKAKKAAKLPLPALLASPAKHT